MRIFFYSFVLFVAITVNGCSIRRDFFGDPISKYHDILKSETRDASYFGLEKVRYLTTVTYRSRALREAYVNEYAERYGLKPAEKEALRAKEMADGEQYDVFFVSHFSTDKDAARLDKSAKVWRLTLEGPNGEALDPDSINTVPTDTTTEYFYPYITMWSSNFLVKFKRGTTAPMTLRMTGVLADVKFNWTAVSQTQP